LIKYSEDNAIFEMSEVRKQLAQHATKDDERNMLNDEELKARILQNLQRTAQPKLMKVIYNVTIYLKKYIIKSI